MKHTKRRVVLIAVAFFAAIGSDAAWAQAFLVKDGQPRAEIITAANPPRMEKLGISAKGLKFGAYRIAAGANWIVFIGDDTDFTPIELWPRGYADIHSGKMQRSGGRSGRRHSNSGLPYGERLPPPCNDRPLALDAHVHRYGCGLPTHFLHLVKRSEPIYEAS